MTDERAVPTTFDLWNEYEIRIHENGKVNARAFIEAAITAKAVEPWREAVKRLMASMAAYDGDEHIAEDWERARVLLANTQPDSPLRESTEGE